MLKTLTEIVAIIFIASFAILIFAFAAYGQKEFPPKLEQFMQVVGMIFDNSLIAFVVLFMAALFTL